MIDAKSTPLHHAAETNNLATIRILLNAGENADAVNSIGRTPLHETKSVEAARLLLDAGANPFIPDDAGNTAFEHQVRRDSLRQPYDPSIMNLLHGHMHALLKAVREKSALYAVAGKALVDPHLIPDLANIAHEYNGYGNLGVVSIESLSSNPERELVPERKIQLLMQQEILKDVFTEMAEEKKAASAASSSPAARLWSNIVIQSASTSLASSPSR